MASGGQSDALQDTKELLFVSRQDGDVTRYGGWKIELLVEDIVSVSEQRLLLCTLCKGMLRDACVITLEGKKQPRCQTCSPFFRPISYNKVDIICSVVDDRMVFCPFLKDSCKWTGPTVSLQTHLKECLYFLVSCPLGCLKSNDLESTQTVLRIQRQLLQDHLLNRCPMRRIPCEYCQEDIQASSVNSHLTICEEYPIQCKNKCTFGAVDDETFTSSRKLMRTHLQYDCPLQQVACPYAQHGCDTTIVRKDVHHHNVDFTGKHLELVENSLKETQISLAKQVEENMVSTKVTKQPLSNGGVEWRILSVKKRIMRSKEFQGPPIYSCGYKFRFYVQFNNQQHLGVKFSLLKGENDDKLKWPLKGEITFFLVNQPQGSIDGLEGTISTENLEGWFGRPTTDNPPCYGFADFISHEDLNNYIINDSILLRVFLTCI